MPAVVRKEGPRRYVVKSHAGAGAQVLGRHNSKANADAQARAVNASLARKGKI